MPTAPEQGQGCGQGVPAYESDLRQERDLNAGGCRRNNRACPAWERSMIGNVIATGVGMLCALLPWMAGAAPSEADYQRCEALKARFNEARARQDLNGMATLFAQDAIRVTPEGVFEGRDAISRSLQGLVGLRDVTTERTVSRREGDLMFTAGTWQGTFGNQSLHGYYSALLSCVGGHQAILQETTNVAAPGHQ